jgi:hypothetical protein
MGLRNRHLGIMLAHQGREHHSLYQHSALKAIYALNRLNNSVAIPPAKNHINLCLAALLLEEHQSGQSIPTPLAAPTAVSSTSSPRMRAIGGVRFECSIDPKPC